ncbi:hypothetical protein LX36DRAFT_320659 [Colletotrichum falcatum]|nr:hypothetical protein LX36DRAFT_320659 [Colletotrichum falcatum]
MTPALAPPPSPGTRLYPSSKQGRTRERATREREREKGRDFAAEREIFEMRKPKWRPASRPRRTTSIRPGIGRGRGTRSAVAQTRFGLRNITNSTGAAALPLPARTKEGASLGGAMQLSTRSVVWFGRGELATGVLVRGHSALDNKVFSLSLPSRPFLFLAFSRTAGRDDAGQGKGKRGLIYPGRPLRDVGPLASCC